MPQAPTMFAYRAPASLHGRQARARQRIMRWAGVALAGLLLTVPIVPLQQGDPARVPLPTGRVGLAGVLPVPGPPIGELAPAGRFATGGAKPFVASYSDPSSALRAETCLTEAIYYEGALEPEAGQRAIAQVVLNRVRHPAYPNTVCGVVFQGQERSTGCQFTFTCDGSRSRAPVPSLWRRANAVARAALAGAVVPEVGLSTHYHADYVMPYWSASLSPAGQIGRHLFYRWRGGAGQPAAFTKAYSGREPAIPAWVARAPAPAASDAPAAATPAIARDAAPRVTPAGVADATPAVAAPSIPPAAAPVPFRARPLTLARKADGPA